MSRGRIELEIRGVRSVLACTVHDDEIVVLADPSTPHWELERELRVVAARAGSDAQIRILGTPAPELIDPSAAEGTSLRMKLALATATLAIIAASVYAGLTMSAADTEQPGPSGPRPTAPAARTS